MPRVALCMMVKNESAVIERSLASARPYVDYWVIADTGSEDDTRERIRAALDGIPGELHDRPWRNFGWNRSDLFDLARGRADYLLLLDADMTVHLDNGWPDLEADCYYMRATGDLDFRLPGLVRGDRHWRYEGAAHEYLATDGDYRSEFPDGFWFTNHADGAGSPTRFERNRVLLEADYERDPNNPRTVFYLGLTFQDLGRPAEAIAWLRRRIEMGGWEEETFFAAYRLGALLAADDWEAGVAALLDAWQRRPQRIEPLYELARGYRIRGAYALTHLFASRAHSIPPCNDILFVGRGLRDWGIPFELAVAAWWLGDYDESLRLNEEMLERGSLPEFIETYARLNRQLELERRDGRPMAAGFGSVDWTDVVPLAELATGASVEPLDLGLRTGDRARDITFARDGKGFVLLVSSDSPDEGAGSSRRGQHHSPQIRVIRLDDDLQRVGNDLRINAAEPSIVPRLNGSHLVNVDDRWIVISAVQSGEIRECQMAALDLPAAELGAFRRLRSPRPPSGDQHWMPFVVAGHVLAVYALNPLVIVEIDAESSECRVVQDALGPVAVTTWRGSSPGVPHDGGYLFVTHEVQRAGGAEQLQTRFVQLDSDFTPVSATPSFAILGSRGARCAGLARLGQDLVVLAQADDATTWTIRVRIQDVAERLQAIA